MKTDSLLLLSFLPALVMADAVDNQLRTLGKADKPRFEIPEITWPAAPGEADICLWKDDKYAAISITIDDNCRPDHDWWLAQAEKHGFKLTWFVITDGVEGKNKGFSGTWADWQRLADAGHSIQSHTSNHCSAKKGEPPLPDEMVHAMYRDSLAAVNTHVTNNVANCIAYPCGEAHEEIAAQYAIACRGVYGAPNPVNKINYLNVNEGNYSQGYINVLLGGEADNPKWLNKPNKPFRRGWCAVLHHLVHHGKTPEQIAKSVSDCEQKLENLAKYKDRIWFGTFQAVAKYGQERDTARLATVSSDETRITLSLADRMDDTLFDEPLTVKVRLPDAWRGLRAVQGGASVPAKFVEHDGHPYALIDAVPDRGEIVLEPAR
ncbi:MAG: polysaccharide deacetylase family protein [Kiritimatiellia bacterium]